MGIHRSLCMSCVAALCSVLFLPTSEAVAQTAKLRLERFDFSRLPDLRQYVTYVEDDGSVIAGRSAGDFKLLIDSLDQGVGASLISFEAAKEPIYSLAVVQVAGAVTETTLSEVKRGLGRVIEVVSRTPGSRIGVIGYGSEIHRYLESGTSAEAEAALRKLRPDADAPETRLVDALHVGIDLLRAQPPGKRKLLILFSDGINVSNDRKLFQQVGEKAQQSGIVIDTIGYSEIDASKLRNLAEITKRCYGIDRYSKSPSELTSRFESVADEISKQYIISFPLSILGDDKTHTFQLVHESGGRPVYSNAVTEKIPALVPRRGDQLARSSRWWVWLLAGVALFGGLFFVLLRRRRQLAPQPALPAPPPVPDAARRTQVQPEAGAAVVGWLSGIAGSYKDKTLELKARTVIGSAPDCDIVLQERYVSAHHCEIRCMDGGFKLIDLGSRNGVVVNDKEVREHILIDNDNFRIGQAVFRFKSIA